MTYFDRIMLIDEIERLTCPRTLRTDEESAARYARLAEICRQFGERFPEDVLCRIDPDAAERRIREDMQYQKDQRS